jgi:hypothetical protein
MKNRASITQTSNKENEMSKFFRVKLSDGHETVVMATTKGGAYRHALIGYPAGVAPLSVSIVEVSHNG